MSKDYMAETVYMELLRWLSVNLEAIRNEKIGLLVELALIG